MSYVLESRPAKKARQGSAAITPVSTLPPPPDSRPYREQLVGWSDGQGNGPPPLRFTADDLDAAYEAWGCNCGPAAFAACLGWDLEAVRPHLIGFAAKRYMNLRDMQAALASAGWDTKRSPGFPEHGLVRVQFTGPWLQPGVPPGAALQHTHWITSKRTADEVWVFDVNSLWTSFDEWKAKTLPRLLKAAKRSDGWDVREAFEVRRATA